MFLENVKMALNCLKANKIRTFLTMLGITLGIASVIAIMIVSDAMNQSVIGSMGEMGANTIQYYLDQNFEYGESGENLTYKERKDSDCLTNEIFEEVQKKYSDSIVGIALEKEMETVKVTEKRKSANMQLKGVNDISLLQKKLNIVSGRSLLQADYENGKKVILVSDKLALNIYTSIDEAMGKTIEVVLGNTIADFTIVGVYEYIEQQSNYGSYSSAEGVTTNGYVPLKTAYTFTRAQEVYDSFVVIAKDGTNPEALCYDISGYINENFYGDNKDFKVSGFSMKEELRSMTSMLNSQKIAFVAVGAIALLVGGIGVMNIMVVSITERTREIGTRKALGATNFSIRLQFITESVVVCILGGTIGIIVGLFMGMIVSKMLNYQGRIRILDIVICFLFSILFGMGFGFYPANKAAKLNPIEALRYE